MGLDDIDEGDPPLQGKCLVAEQRQAPTSKPKNNNSNNNNSGGSGTSAPFDFGALFGGPVVSSSNGGGVHVDTGSVQRCGSEEQWAWISAAPRQQQQSGQQSGQQTSHAGEKKWTPSNDPLDSFFATPVLNAPSPTAAVRQEQNVDNDLFDFSKPPERARYSDERTFLEAFENHSKGRSAEGRDGPSLADLVQGSSNNVVKARLLKIMNYYDVLGVTRDATEEQIRRRYKLKALELHPDRVGRDQTPEEVELFKEMTKAYEVLCDPKERAKYDDELRHSSADVDNSANWFFHLHS